MYIYISIYICIHLCFPHSGSRRIDTQLNGDTTCLLVIYIHTKVDVCIHIYIWTNLWFSHTPCLTGVTRGSTAHNTLHTTWEKQSTHIYTYITQTYTTRQYVCLFMCMYIYIHTFVLFTCAPHRRDTRLNRETTCCILGRASTWMLQHSSATASNSLSISVSSPTSSFSTPCSVLRGCTRASTSCTKRPYANACIYMYIYVNTYVYLCTCMYIYIIYTYT